MFGCSRGPCDHRDLCGRRPLRAFFDLHLVCVLGGLLPGRAASVEPAC
ncbi:hypothetical protein ACFPM0_16450 [Pseudonocardia sulfidoxydans]